MSNRVTTKLLVPFVIPACFRSLISVPLSGAFSVSIFIQSTGQALSHFKHPMQSSCQHEVEI